MTMLGEQDRDADEVDVEAEQVEPWERDVLRAEHDRQEEVAQRGRARSG